MSLKLFTHYLAPIGKTGGIGLVEKPTVQYPKGRIIEGSFSRPDVGATSGATVFDANGNLIELAEDYPDWNYLADGSGPVLSMRPQKTNYMLNSENIAGWTAISGVGATANNQTAPDGATTGDTITGDGTSTACRLNQSVTVAGGGEHIFSCFLKAGTNDFAAIDASGFIGGSGTGFSYFDLANGTTPTTGAKITDVGNGWYYCQSAPFTIDAGDLSGNMSIYITRDDTIRDFATAGDANGQSVYAWGAEVKEGSYDNSYIPTVASAVTRSGNNFEFTDLINKGALSDTKWSFIISLGSYLFTGPTSVGGRLRTSGGQDVLRLNPLGSGDRYDVYDNINLSYYDPSVQLYANQSLVITYNNGLINLYKSDGSNDSSDVGAYSISEFVLIGLPSVEITALAFCPIVLTQAQAIAAITEVQNL